METGWKARKIAVVVLLSSMMLAAGVVSSSAELNPPTWMPSSPILAGNQVILLWIPSPNAVKYNIYMNNIKIGESSTVQYMHPAPSEAGEYRFELTALDAGGSESKRSIPGMVRIIKIEPPAEVYTRATEKTIQIRWDVAKGAIIYNVYRGEKGGGDPVLLGSVQGDSFTDTDVKAGRMYNYYVSSKDLAGKESKKSNPAVAKLLAPVKIDQASKVTLKIVSTAFGESSSLSGENAVNAFTDLKIGPDGALFLLDAKTNQVFRLNRETLAVETRFGCETSGSCRSRLFNAMDFGPDGLLYVNDPWAKKVFVFTTNGEFRFEFPIPEVKDKAVLANVPESNLKKGSLTNGIAIDRKNSIVYVVDENLNTIHKFGLHGDLLGYVGHGGDDPEKNLLGPGRAALSPEGELYVSQPLTHLIHVLNPESGEIVRTVGKRGTGYVGAFIGVGGMSFDPKGNLVVSDSGVHSVQVFDGKTGEYLYHFGDETGKPDEEMKDRASLDAIRYPVGALVGKDGKLFLFRGDRKQIVSRSLLSK